MPRGYRRKHRRNYGRLAIVGSAAFVVLGLCIGWVWKSNQVKEYSSKLRRLTTERANLIAENMRLRTGLLDLKSLSVIDKIVTTEYGLTQDVAERIFLSDPVTPEKKSKMNFASDTEIPDWLENAVVGSGRVRAESHKEQGQKK